MKANLEQSLRRLTNKDDIGITFGRTTFNPSSLPIISVSWISKASFAFSGSVKELPALSRAAPRKNGIISTETPCTLRRSRKRNILVKPNQE